MTHSESIAILVASSSPGGRRVAGDARERALDHLARCSDCWKIVRTLHLVATGAPPPGDEQISRTFGCENVQERLHAVAGLAPDEIAARLPDVAAHLDWCVACRERLIDLGTFAAALEADAIPSLSSPRDRSSRGEELGRRCIRLAGRLVARASGGMAGFLEVPPGAFAVPRLAAEPMRSGGKPDASQIKIPSNVRVTLQEPGLSFEIATISHGSGQITLQIGSVVGVAPRAAVRLRERVGEKYVLCASETITSTNLIAFHALPPGDYLLEIGSGDDVVYQFALVLEVPQ